MAESPGSSEPTRPEPSTTVKTTLITVIGSVVVAVLTTVGTIATSSNGIKTNTEKLEASNAKIEVLNAKANALEKPSLPVGTVVASLLTPPEFAKETGDPDNFDVTKSKWTWPMANRFPVLGGLRFVATRLFPTSAVFFSGARKIVTSERK